MVNYNKVQSLRIESAITSNNVKFLFENLKELKYLELVNIKAKDLRIIFENSLLRPNLQQLRLMVRPTNIGSEFKVKVNYKSVNIALHKMVKFGHFGLINSVDGMSNFIFVPKSHFLLASYETDITSLLKSKVFQEIKYLILYSTAYGLSGVYEMLKKSNIQTLCIQEHKISQELINLFLGKAKFNPNINYNISIISEIEPNKCFNICKNFTVYLNTRIIVENKIL